MPDLTIHRLTDPFALPTQLAAALGGADAPDDPLALVQVVLPAAGWRGWLARALADRLGVLAGVELLDVAGFRRQFAALSADSTLSRVLALQACLPAVADPMLAAWLQQDPDGCWRVSLAQLLAQVLAEDAVQRPLLFVEDSPAAPSWWHALRAVLPPPPVLTALDSTAPVAALHWVATTPPLAHDWALLSGLSRERRVTVWLLEPAAGTLRHPLLTVLAPEAPLLPSALSATLRPLPLTEDLAPAETGALSGLRRALASGTAELTLPPDALTVLTAPDVSGQLRLAEALLRERFAADPTLLPADVLLLTPELPAAAALIDAVFGAAAGAPWPYRIGGRRGPQPAVRLLQQLLAVPTARLTVSELLALLQSTALVAGLQLDADAVARLLLLVPEAGVGWGLDAQTRRDWQAGDDDTHSWRGQWPLLAAGLADADPLQQGLPRLFDALAAYRDATVGTPPLSTHWTAFEALLRAVLPPRRQQAAADAVWLTWASLAAERAAVEGDPALSQPAFAAVLSPLLALHAAQDPPKAGPQTAGPQTVASADTAAPEAGLRFAALRPGAVRPARVIVLFGLDAISFPRRAVVGPLSALRAALDAAHPALAPAAPDVLDRQLLLESLWMAADACIWLCSDQDRSSGQRLPLPAPIDAALAVLPAPRVHAPALPIWTAMPADAPAPAVKPGRPSEVDLSAFCSCFRDPARFQLEQVRRMKLPSPPLPDDGPLTVTGLAAWRIRTALLQVLDRRGEAGLPGQPAARDLALLPPGSVGIAAWQTLRTQALALWRYSSDLMLDGGKPERIAVDLELEDPPLRLTGTLRVHDAQLFERVAGRPEARHLVHAWLRGLTLAAMGVPRAQLLLTGLDGEGQPMHLLPVLPKPEQAQETLGKLLGWYARAWSRPLPFTPGMGLALATGNEREAHWRWVGSERNPGESREPLQAWLWQGADLSAPPHLAGLSELTRLLLPPRLLDPWREHWR